MPEINPENIILPDSTALTKEEIVDSIVNFNLADTLGSWVDKALNIGIRVLLAILIFYVGRWLIGLIMKGVTRLLDRRVEALGLRHFVRSIARAGLWIVLALPLYPSPHCSPLSVWPLVWHFQGSYRTLRVELSS